MNGGIVRSMDTRLHGYIVRHVCSKPHTWHLILAATGEHLRTYTDFERATMDAKRYARLTAGLSK